MNDTQLNDVSNQSQIFFVNMPQQEQKNQQQQQVLSVLTSDQQQQQVLPVTVVQQGNKSIHNYLENSIFVISS
jgi:hypothetical protein